MTVIATDVEENADGAPMTTVEALNQAFEAYERIWRGPDRDPELSRLRYADYLRTDHWRETRERALMRAGHQCKRCEATDRRLDVHHLSYERLGRELESDLTVLCSICHAIEHGEPISDRDWMIATEAEHFAAFEARRRRR
jgi:hypothetical protein